MNTQTSLVAEQVRLQQWADQIKACQARPSEMKIETWCEQNGVTKANYYYRLRRVREACLKQAEKQPVHFLELPIPSEQNIASKYTAEPVAIIHGSKNQSVELYANATAAFIRTLLEAISDAE